MSIPSVVLVEAARGAADTAYCPYSNYPVGAALLDAAGRIHTGCNVENAVHGLAICAERAALFAAVGRGVREFAALAVAGGADRPAYPCGACRQVLAEFAPPSLPVFIARLDGGGIVETTLGELLPLAFSLKGNAP